MAKVTELDLKGRTEGPDPRDAVDHPPSNIEAEQGLLGIALFDSEACHTLSGQLQPRHFYEPLHGRLWNAVAVMVNRGRRADPAVLIEQFRRDAAFQDIGGVRYLADLVDRAPASINAPEYEAVIIDLALRRDLLRLGQEMAQWAKAPPAPEEDGEAPPDGKAIAAEFERRLTEVQIKSRRNELTTLDSVVAGVLAYLDDPNDTTGVSTGLAPLDLAIGPMMPGDLILNAARPSMGKSAVGLAVALNVGAPAVADWLNGRAYDNRSAAGVIEVHGEMGWEDGKRGVQRGGQVARRHLADVGYGLYADRFPTYRQIRDRKISVDQRAMITEAMGHLTGHPIVGFKRSGVTVSELRSLCRRQAAEWARAGIPLGLLIIDHVGLMRPDRAIRSRYEAQTEIAFALKELADELGVPVLALVQLSRDVDRRDDKKPNMGDLRDSGAWEEAADVIAMPYREAYYAAREKQPEAHGKDWDEWLLRKNSLDIEIGLPKIREGEGGGTARLWGQVAWNAIRGAMPDRELSAFI